MIRLITNFKVVAFSFVCAVSFGQQKKCVAMDVHNRNVQKNPEVQTRMNQGNHQISDYLATHNNLWNKRADITIPVVVHVLYNNATENISYAQIQSQIARLNTDFRQENADSLNPNDGGAGEAYHQFCVGKNNYVEFCLASVDPNGNPTNGITRTQTDSTAFTGLGFEKSSATGGHDNWDPTKYLNIWVCNLDNTDGTLGYASFPFELESNPELDGVVLRYEAFGSNGTAGTGGFSGNDRGRTGTHEVGHWLALYHIWGDNQPDCGDDLVDDTKGARAPNFTNMGISFPWNTFNGCGSGATGEMYMNYMDYPDDAEIVMFTTGQMDRMGAVIEQLRPGLMTSNGCDGNAKLNELDNNLKFSVFPNPSKGTFEVKFINSDNNHVFITNVIGEKVADFANVNNGNNTINLSGFTNGIYYVNVTNGTNIETRKITILK